jgi:hypothetical protein
MMLTHLKGVRSENHENRSWNQVLDSYGAEAAWRLGQWDSLSELLNNHNMIENGSFEVAFGKLLCSIRQRDQECVAELLSNARCVLGPQLRSVVSDSYGKSYDTVVKLHMIEEVRICWEFINDQSKHNQNGYDNLLQQLDYRLRCCSSIFKHQEPILNLRRILLDELSYAFHFSFPKLFILY